MEAKIGIITFIFPTSVFYRRKDLSFRKVMQLPTKKQIPYGGTETLSFQDGMVK